MRRAPAMGDSTGLINTDNTSCCAVLRSSYLPVNAAGILIFTWSGQPEVVKAEILQVWAFSFNVWIFIQTNNNGGQMVLVESTH
jgi:hypothetical protein